MKRVWIALIAITLYNSVSAQNTEPEPLRIDFKNRGYFYAASPPLASTSGFGGWGGSGNMYQMMENLSGYASNTVVVSIDVSTPARFAEKYKGYTLQLINTKKDTIFFDVQDSRLNMKLQARDTDGKWKDIEYLPSSWCGNSYHMLYLPKGCYWSFTIPAYDGKIRTFVRAALAWKTSRDSEEQWIYSNEVPAGINPGQFTNIPKYNSSGIMDPYDN
ncbi:MAG TPA: hypothetical protein VGK59_15110 [Ohtaekwangia sp.]